MRLTVLGGTGMLGRAVVEAALVRGCHVTSVSRGESGAPRGGVEAIFADCATRSGLERIAQQVRSDVVLDCIGWLTPGPGIGQSVLQPSFNYVHVLAQPTSRGGPVITEDLVVPNALTVSPGIMCGPGDNSGYLTSWLQRMNDDFQVIVPRALTAAVQVSDARDVAAALITAALHRQHGLARAYPDASTLTLGQIIDASIASVTAAGGSPGELIAVPDAVLASAEVSWRELPWWTSPGSPAPIPSTWGLLDAPYLSSESSHSLAATVSDTWAWMQSGEVFLSSADDGGPGLRLEQHTALVAAARKHPDGVASILEARTQRPGPH